MNLFHDLVTGVNIAASDSTLKPDIATEFNFRNSLLGIKTPNNNNRFYFEVLANPSTAEDKKIGIPALILQTDNLVFNSQPATLTGKVMDYNSNTFQNFPPVGNAAGNTATFSGNASNKIFTMAHGYSGTPNSVVVVPKSIDALGDYVVTWDATNITVTYQQAPATGTNNVVLSWMIATSISTSGFTPGSTDVLTNKDLTSSTNTFPTSLEMTANKNAANGYAGLDSSTRLTKALQHANTVYNDQSNSWTVAQNLTSGSQVNSQTIETQNNKNATNGYAGLSSGLIALSQIPTLDNAHIPTTLTGKTIDLQSNTASNNVIPASFIGYKSGSTYYVRDLIAGTTTSNSDAATVFQACLDSIKNTGRRLHLIGNTSYSLSTSLLASVSQKLTGESKYNTELKVTGDFPAVIIQDTTGTGASDVGLSELKFTHDQATFSGGLVELRTTSGHSISQVDIEACRFSDSGRGVGNAIRYSINAAPIYKIRVLNSKIDGFLDQIYIKFNGGTSNDWSTTNIFNMIFHWFPINTAFKVDSPSGAQFDGNDFANCYVQAGSLTQGWDFNTAHVGHSWYTSFTNCFVWDLTSGKDAWIFNGISEGHLLGCYPDQRIGGSGATNGKIIKKSTYSHRYGTATFSGDGSTTAFTVTTNLPTTGGSVTPSLKSVRIEPTGIDATGNRYITTSGTSFTVNYAIAPPSGSSNVTFFWEAQT